MISQVYWNDLMIWLMCDVTTCTCRDSVLVTHVIQAVDVIQFANVVACLSHASSSAYVRVHPLP